MARGSALNTGRHVGSSARRERLLKGSKTGAEAIACSSARCDDYYLDHVAPSACPSSFLGDAGASAMRARKCHSLQECEAAHTTDLLLARRARLSGTDEPDVLKDVITAPGVLVSALPKLALLTRTERAFGQ